MGRVVDYECPACGYTAEDAAERAEAYACGACRRGEIMHVVDEFEGEPA